jgi:DHA1 family bicyclomycin/chloramphenicol resistance-like MFS transporter
MLLLLTVFGPISMDLYLPLLPALTTQLGVATSTAQLTITACLVGLALGQLVAGPVSDRFGRSLPLYVGVLAYIGTSLLCAVSPNDEQLVVARLVQGAAGGVGIVIAQAAGRDLYSGGALIRYYGRVTVLSGLAAVVGPLLGGQLATVTDWRGLFVFLAGLGAAILVAIALVHRETLPPEQRTSGGLIQTAQDVRALLADRRFTGAVLLQGGVHAALFAYLSGATYVLQDTYGFTPQQYASAFGLNSAGFMVFGYLAARTSERWSLRGTLAAGLALSATGALGLVAAGVAALPAQAVVVSLLVMVSGVAATVPPATTIALADQPHVAGTASSLLGAARFAFGGLSAPLVGLFGAPVLLPLGVVALACIGLAGAAYALTADHRSTPDTRLPLTDHRRDPQPVT